MAEKASDKKTKSTSALEKIIKDFKENGRKPTIKKGPKFSIISFIEGNEKESEIKVVQSIECPTNEPADNDVIISVEDDINRKPNIKRKPNNNVKSGQGRDDAA